MASISQKLVVKIKPRTEENCVDKTDLKILVTLKPKTENRDRLFFYSKSKDVDPGQGVNEIVQNKNEYLELSQIPNWRHILSNLDTESFKFLQWTYNSIEHAFQSHKIALVDPEKAFWFTRESNHEIGQGDGLKARKARKLVILDPEKLKLWAQQSQSIMTQATQAKFKSSERFQKVLLSTKKAELWHIQIRQSPIRFEHLEQIRDAHLPN